MENFVIQGNRLINPGVAAGAPEKVVSATGSGTIVTADGLILTNWHVWEVTLREPWFELADNGRRLFRFTPLRGSMLVFELDRQRPMRPPELKYRATLLAGDRRYDVAVLKVSTLATGAPLARRDFSAVSLGNPYAIPLGGLLHIYGYPGKGGATITPTETKFLGYTRQTPHAIDGAFKTISTVAGGNSGGAALYDNRLVGIPTLVSAKPEKGAEFAYIHPVTWGAGPLAFAALRYSQPIPAIDRRWLESEENNDITRTHTFLGGKVSAALALNKPVVGAQVAFHRPDRTWEQILALDADVTRIKRALDVQRLLQTMTPEQVAEKLKIPLPSVHDLIRVPLDARHWPPDVQKYVKGEFFYVATQTLEPDGFFFVNVPRGVRLKMVVSAEGFRMLATDRASGDALYRDVGPITVAELQRPAPPVFRWGLGR